MGLYFDAGDRFAISQLLLENNDEIIFKTDRDGFLSEATPSITELGFSLVEMLIGPHISDLVGKRFRPVVEIAVERALEGHKPAGWIEFRSSSGKSDRRWFALRLTALRNGDGKICGTLGIVRSRGEAKQLEERLFRAELTDPLTGLTNRRAWLHMIEHLAEIRAPSSLALVELDFFRAINLYHGLAAGDEFLVDFADFLRTISPEDVGISRVGGSRFSLLFPEWNAARAVGFCHEVIEVLASFACPDQERRIPITISIGLATVTSDLDQTVKAGEAALRLARAKGGNTVASAPNPRSPLNSRAAMR